MRMLIAFLLLCSQCYGIDYIRTHHELIPAIGSDATLNAPNATANESFRIESGQTVVITGNQSCKDIYVNGAGDEDAVLELSNNCELRCQTIVLFGTRAILRTTTGTAIKCRIVFRDLPFDLVNDPQQFSNGIICISGQVLLNGIDPRDVSTKCMGHLRAGANIIHLDSTPPSWKVGDAVYIPDTRQPVVGQVNNTESATIASRTNNSITLTAPLQFEHKHYESEDGLVAEFFSIANVTQPIVIESENPNGIRGHIIFLDHSRVIISGVQFKELCRTTTAPLDSTTWTRPGDPTSITHIGTNQIGRYIHFHGCPGRNEGDEWQQEMQYFSIVGSPKLGLVLHHSSHFGLYEHFAIVDCAGGALVTETPNVYGNVFRDAILIGKRQGSRERITNRAHRNLAGGDHWHCTCGLALQSAMNEFHNIDIYSCQEGIGITGFRTTGLFKPLTRGEHDTATNRERLNPGNAEFRYPFLPSSNVTVTGCYRGIETWTTDCYENTERMFPGLELVHCAKPSDFEDMRETYIRDWRVLGDASLTTPVLNNEPSSTVSVALDWKDAYRFGRTIVGGEISGYDVPIDLVHDQEYTILREVNIHDCRALLYEPLGHLSRGDCTVLIEDCNIDTDITITGWLPKFQLSLWIGNPESADNRQSLSDMSINIYPNEDGRDIDIYHKEQLASYTLPPIPEDQGYADWPLGVNTNAQLIQLGTPIYGFVTPQSAVQGIGVESSFWFDDVTPLPLTVEERLDRIERILGIE